MRRTIARHCCLRDPGFATTQSAYCRCSKPVESACPERKGVLLAHAVSTRTDNKIVREDDMAIPRDWMEGPHAEAHLDQKKYGRTLALHSLAVLPEYQSRGLGEMLMKAYIERIRTSGVADRIAMLTYDRLVPFYERFGFKNKGKSNVKFGGESWNDMVFNMQW